MKVVAVTDRKQSVRPFLEQIELIASTGADMIVLREKDLSAEEYSELASKVKEICDRHGTVLCINSFTDVAEDIGAECVWIPYPEFIKNGRSSIPNVGVSVHSLEEAENALSLNADFLVYGNVFETTCKPGKEAKGFDELRHISVLSDVPVYAIGGINPSNMQSVHDCGVDGVCMMSEFMKAEDPALLVSKARNLLE